MVLDVEYKQKSQFMQEMAMTSLDWFRFVFAGLTLLAMLHWTSRRAHSSLNTFTLCRNEPAGNASHWHDGCANLLATIPTIAMTHSVRMQQSMTCSMRQLRGRWSTKFGIFSDGQNCQGRIPLPPVVGRIWTAQLAVGGKHKSKMANRYGLMMWKTMMKRIILGSPQRE